MIRISVPMLSIGDSTLILLLIHCDKNDEALIPVTEGLPISIEFRNICLQIYWWFPTNSLTIGASEKWLFNELFSSALIMKTNHVQVSQRSLIISDSKNFR